MPKDRKILYFVSVALFAALLAVLFAAAGSGRLIAAILLPIAAAATVTVIKKRSIHSIFKNQVLLIMAVSGLLYVMLYYLSGLFFGFGRSLAFGLASVIEYVLPITSIIVSTEIIRDVLVSQKSRVADAFAYLCCVGGEILAFGDIARIHSFNLFMDLLGITVFPALIGNILYHYIAKRYGVLPNIAYRLITSLYLYVFYYVPAMPGSLLALARLIIPIIIFIFIDALFEKKRHYALKKKSKLGYISAVLASAFMIFVVMIISCQFRFGALVIGSDSMADEINKGDAVVYERYDGQGVEVGEVIIFERAGSRFVHRVVDVKRIDSQTRYYTQGDANEDMDPGFVTETDIIGVCRFKLPYVGYPTVWIRSVLDF